MQTNDTAARYEILIFNVKGHPGLEAVKYTRNYPTWHDMMQLCLDCGITNCSDFKDIDNCLDNDVRVVYGYGMNYYNGSSKVLDFQITKLSDIPTVYEELVIRSGE